jgi:hypothetical protein
MGTAVAEVAQVQIDEIPAQTIKVPIIGTAPLIIHRFSEKAKRQMLENMQGIKRVKENKNPEQEYIDALYRLKNPDGYGFPAIGFKEATIAGCRYYGTKVTMASMRQFIFFSGEFGSDGRMMCRIEGEPHRREDVVTVGNNGHDLRYRPQFSEWNAILTVTFVTTALTQGSLLSLIDAGGMGVGVGEWRPQKRGEFGTYTIDKSKNIEVV